MTNHALFEVLPHLFAGKDLDVNVPLTFRFCHQQAVDAGWWTDLDTGERMSKPWTQCVALIHSELSEALEGDRKGLMDDKLPDRSMFEVELADTFIRLADVAGGFNLTIDALSILVDFERIAGGLFVKFLTPVEAPTYDWITHCHRWVSLMGDPGPRARANGVATTLLALIQANRAYNLDLPGAIIDKLEFNRQRADHKVENRQKSGGKAY